MSGFHHPLPKVCRCGSGEPRRDLVDGHGIFCAFVCDVCEAEKRREFDPRIFAGPYETDEPIEGDE